jgi:hypothetical protein
MQFNPEYNYGDSDFTVKENVVCWKFGELVKTLVTLSSEAKEQIEIMGLGLVSEEMAEDFDTYFTLMFDEYIDGKLLTLHQVEQLKQLETFFNERSNNEFSDFWDDALLSTSADWEIVRQKSSNILALLGMEDLEIRFSREEKCETPHYSKKELFIQSTKTYLVRKHDK